MTCSNLSVTHFSSLAVGLPSVTVAEDYVEIRNDVIAVRWAVTPNLRLSSVDDRRGSTKVLAKDADFSIKFSDGIVAMSEDFTVQLPPLSFEVHANLSSPKLGDHYSGVGLEVRTVPLCLRTARGGQLQLNSTFVVLQMVWFRDCDAVGGVFEKRRRSNPA